MFFCEICKSLKTPILKNICEQLLPEPKRTFIEFSLKYFFNTQLVCHFVDSSLLFKQTNVTFPSTECASRTVLIGHLFIHLFLELIFFVFDSLLSLFFSFLPWLMCAAEKIEFSAKNYNVVPQIINLVPKKFQFSARKFPFSAKNFQFSVQNLQICTEKIQLSAKKKFKIVLKKLKIVPKKIEK